MLIQSNLLVVHKQLTRYKGTRCWLIDMVKSDSFGNWVIVRSSICQYVISGDLSHLIQKGEVAPLKSASANLTAENGHRENRDNNELYRAAILGDQQAMANLKPTGIGKTQNVWILSMKLFFNSWNSLQKGPLSAILDGDEMYHCLQDDDTITIGKKRTSYLKFNIKSW